MAQAAISNIADIKRMLNSLRVYELQDFLSAASQARAGRKPELVARAMAAVQRDHRLVARLRQLYEAKRCTTSLTGFRSRPAPYHKVESERTLPTAAPSAAHGQINKRGIMPVDVKFCRLAFYDHIDTIIRASYLRDMSSSLYSRSRSDRSMASVHFQLTPAQSQQIRAGRSVRYGKMNSIQEHYNIQVQLRLCKLETSCQQRDKFPSMCTITVNNNVVPLPSYVYSPVELKKCGVPLDITRFCRLQPYEDNSIRVAWVNNAQQPQQYSMQLTLVKELSSSNLLHQLRTKGIRNADHSRALIKDKLTNSPESEVALTSLRVSLLCPLGKMRMSLPCRGAACNHLQCFDGTLYVQMNEKKSSWICPVCDQALPFESLFIDGLFTEILSANPRSNEIEFLHDGSWKVMQQQSGKTDFSVLTSKFGSPASCNGLEGPDAIIAGLMRKPDSSLSALPPKSHTQTSGGSAAAHPIVIDLTDLDSDDETSKPSQPQASQASCITSLNTTAAFISPISSPPPLHSVLSGSFHMQPTMYQQHIPFLTQTQAPTAATGINQYYNVIDGMPDLFGNSDSTTDIISVD